MLVIMDMEWVDWFGLINPTQITALRVTEDWKELIRFNKLICPPSTEKKTKWDHIGFTGWSADDFLRGSDAPTALSMLSCWLSRDDVLLWWSEPTAVTFASVWKKLLHAPVPFAMRLISPAIREELIGKGLPVKGSAYGMAAAAGLPIMEKEHCSSDDVTMIRRLLEFLRADSGKILNGPVPDLEAKVGQTGMKHRSEYNPSLDYVLDKTNKRAHRLGCDRIPAGCEKRSMGTIEGVIRSAYAPCTCVAEEYWTYSWERAKECIRKMQLNFVYSEKTGLFHKPSCIHVRHIPFQKIRGSIRYETALWSGHSPCGWCKPSIGDEKASVRAGRLYRDVFFRKTTGIPLKAQKEKKATPMPGKNLNRFELNAVKRHAQAVKERAALPGNLTGLRDRDAHVLSQSGFAFWMSEGYQTFHLRSCPKLNGLSHLHGYARFSDACRFGKPCRHCRPSKKNDILASVPMNQQVRMNETVEQIDILCERYGWKHENRKNGYYLETPEACWILKTGTHPLEVMHMPKGSDHYHRQHRTFLSMTDTVEYIRQHDGTPSPATIRATVPEESRKKSFMELFLDGRERLAGNGEETEAAIG